MSQLGCPGFYGVLQGPGVEGGVPEVMVHTSVRRRRIAAYSHFMRTHAHT